MLSCFQLLSWFMLSSSVNSVVAAYFWRIDPLEPHGGCSGEPQRPTMVHLGEASAEGRHGVGVRANKGQSDFCR